tara:strand:+ start:6204 stop:7070 length:867 start_codon:yes stop_codon:yes gene_type:complete
MKLQLKKFDMSSIASDKVVVLIGKRDTGKSFLCRDLLWYHQRIPVGTVISATELANNFYSKMVPPIFIHNEYSEDIVQRVLLRQEKALMKKRQIELRNRGMQFAGGNKPDNMNAFLILDDCLYDSSWTKSKAVRSLFMNGRHFKMLFIITMQYALGIPPNLRTNIDYVFILRENIVQNRRRLYECYAGMFPTFEVFSAVMDQCTENYECLVINNNAKSNRLEDQVFWYKAQEHPSFKLGSKELWSYNNKNYNGQVTKKNEDEVQYDPKAFSTKSNKPQVNVHKYNHIL